VQEIENPELATKRTRTLYKLKGYSDDWIEKRMRGIAIREELTDEWQKRGANEIDEQWVLKTALLGDTIESVLSETGGTKSLKVVDWTA